MTGRAPCGCPVTWKGAIVHRIACKVRVGTPVVSPPTPVEVAQARKDITEAFRQIADRAQHEAYSSGASTAADVDAFIEWAKQRLEVIALARAVLPSDDGKANPSND